MLAFCVGLCGCAAVEPVESSGAVSGKAPLSTLALEVSPIYAPNNANQHGSAEIGEAATPGVSRFAGSFARVVSDNLPQLMATHGVSVQARAPGIPLLRMHVAGFRVECHHHKQDCQEEVRVNGSLLDEAGTREWSFSDWLVPDEMDAKGYDIFFNQLLATMSKDQLLPAAGG